MILADFVAIEIHVPAERNRRQPLDAAQATFEEAATAFFKPAAKRLFGDPA